MWNKKPDVMDLQKRLFQIMPEHQPISKLEWGQEGTFKAVDSDGTVYLVQFKRFYQPDGSVKLGRKKTPVMNYQKLVEMSDLAMDTAPRDATWEVKAHARYLKEDI